MTVFAVAVRDRVRCAMGAIGGVGWLAGGASCGVDTRERAQCATGAASTPLEVTGPGRMGIGRAWRWSAWGVDGWVRGGATLGCCASASSGARAVGTLGGA